MSAVWSSKFSALPRSSGISFWAGLHWKSRCVNWWHDEWCDFHPYSLLLHSERSPPSRGPKTRGRAPGGIRQCVWGVCLYVFLCESSDRAILSVLFPSSFSTLLPLDAGEVDSERPGINTNWFSQLDIFSTCLSSHRLEQICNYSCTPACFHWLCRPLCCIYDWLLLQSEHTEVFENKTQLQERIFETAELLVWVEI